nr:ParB/RepB/Spo0J family partition protein [Motilibacter deserti]
MIPTSARPEPTRQAGPAETTGQPADASAAGQGEKAGQRSGSGSGAGAHEGSGTDSTAGAPAGSAGASGDGTPGGSDAAAQAAANGTPAAGAGETAASSDGAADEELDAGAHYAEVPISAISPNPRQPRLVFDEDELAELAESIGVVGLLQPVVVRPVAGGRYELVMGERRWRASQRAGLETIPAIVRTTQDGDLLRDALLENLHRSQLNPLEEAAAYGQLLEDFGCTHEELSKRLGRSRPQISNTLRLLKLPAVVQRRLAAGVLSAGHARALLGLSDAAAQERLAQRIVAEGLSVRAVEEIVALDKQEPSAAAPRRRLRPPVSPRLSELSDRLSDRFETRVKVDLGRRKGKIVLEFASLDDLERIVGILEPGAEVPPAD